VIKAFTASKGYIVLTAHQLPDASPRFQNNTLVDNDHGRLNEQNRHRWPMNHRVLPDNDPAWGLEDQQKALNLSHLANNPDTIPKHYRAFQIIPNYYTEIVSQ
jgi:hypothetical protein